MMRRIVLFLFASFLFMNVFSLEFIFRDDTKYAGIENLQRSGVLDIDLNNLPIRSDALVEKLLEALDLEEAGKIIITKEQSYVIGSLLKRFYEKDFVIKDNFSAAYVFGRAFADMPNTTYYSDMFLYPEEFSDRSFPFNYYYVNNSVYLKKEISGGLLVFNLKTTAPFENSDSTCFRMDEWKGTGSDMYNSYIGMYNETGYILFGRILPAWGQGIRDNIFLSRNILPLDGILAEADWGNSKFSFFLANKTEYHYANKRTTDNAYLSAHKIEIGLPFKTDVSFKEIVLYRSNLPQLYYLNPAMFYYIVQYNSHSDDNIFWSIEFVNRYFRGFVFSGELFIDDFQYESAAFYVPNKIGYLVNASYSPLFAKNMILSSEYCRINTYTNTHEYSQLAYVYYRRAMSYGGGTDMDLFLVKTEYSFFERLKAEWCFVFSREGEGDLLVSWESERPLTAPSFPSGIVTSLTESYINFSFEQSDKISFLGGISFFRMDEESVAENGFSFSIKAKMAVTL